MSRLPMVDERTCIGCAECVEICPTACLEMAGSRPWLPRPRDCTACTACELVCPTDAIEMREPNPNE